LDGRPPGSANALLLESPLKLGVENDTLRLMKLIAGGAFDLNPSGGRAMMISLGRLGDAQRSLLVHITRDTTINDFAWL